VKISITDISGRVVRELDGTATQGINRVQWNLAPTPQPGAGGRGGGGGGGGGFGGGGAVPAGTYRVTLTVGSTTQSKILTILEDKWMDER
jgi:hypothetical protein